MDLDGDGFLSMYELEYFYEEQLQRMESLGIETLPFEDCLCQVRVSMNDRPWVIFYLVFPYFFTAKIFFLTRCSI